MAPVYFATNRNPNRKNNPDDFGGQFNPGSVDGLRFGVAEVANGANGYSVSSISVAPERMHEDPTRSVLGSKAIFADLQEEMARGVDTLVFVHGYNVSFHEALVTGGQLADKYGAAHPLNVAVFSWPSDGSLLPILAYKRDRTDAAASAPAFARALMKLASFLADVERGHECKARLHLMAHSMGNYVLRHGLQEVRRVVGSVPKVFDQIFLMAADEDHDAFEHDHKLQPLPNLGKRANIYFNRGDTALVISDRTKSNPTRLGNEGPRLPLNVPGNVTLIDASEVVHGVLEHSYFVNHEITIRDVVSVLDNKPEDTMEWRRYVPSQNRYVLTDQ